MADGMQKSYALVAIFLWVCVCFCSYFSALTILYTSLSRPAVHGNDRFSAAPVLRRWCGVAPVERGSRITSVCSVNEMSPMFLRLWWNESVETKTANLVAKTRLPLVTVVGVFFLFANFTDVTFSIRYVIWLLSTGFATPGLSGETGVSNRRLHSISHGVR